MFAQFAFNKIPFYSTVQRVLMVPYLCSHMTCQVLVLNCTCVFYEERLEALNITLYR